ncbi:tRNA (N6-isopentenyl adenosine(37)-C2)-methylthiotransferase MiaB [Candidatus Purcelliella pentastirinorum]
MSKKFFIKTWGCQMNEYDSLKMAELLKVKNGYIHTKNINDADILLLNTCSIREKAQEKVFHQLGRWKKLKKKKDNLLICVGGCVASQEGKYILKRASFVDIIFGPKTIHYLPNMINKLIYNNNTKIINIKCKTLEKFNHLPELKYFNFIASITIMEGCNKFCSFCIVPYTRGRELSRSVDDILFEINKLVDCGVKELTLLGQNVNAYKGIDSSGKIYNFSMLLRKISKIHDIKRIKFISNHPLYFTDDIIDVYRDIPKIMSYLHLPVQSGSDKILKLMKRGHTISYYKNIIKKLISIRPEIRISSDFIIGFPGENEEDFNKTMQLISEINFDHSYSFIYSKRKYTKAYYLNDFISYKKKQKRLYKLQNLIKEQINIWSRSMIGTKQVILVEGKSKWNNKFYFGRTHTNKIINFIGNVNIIGKFIKLKITNLYKNMLFGEIYN